MRNLKFAFITLFTLLILVHAPEPAISDPITCTVIGDIPCDWDSDFDPTNPTHLEPDYDQTEYYGCVYYDNAPVGCDFCLGILFDRVCEYRCQGGYLSAVAKICDCESGACVPE